MSSSLKLTKSIEDYLEVMYNLQKNNGTIKVKDIALNLNVKPPSVVEAIKKLSESELVSYERYGDINLTKKGFEIAENVIHKHDIIKNFLNILGVDMDTADEEACAMEHILNSSTINKLKKFADFAKMYPEAPNFFESFHHYEKYGELPDND
ncbi:metal-dependent transcriptional regulator [Methanobacterium aggregans]|uniref:metal-dependent transcriptional regulator n=1 Tax=Methanobacterium aggregans TaxID=1615586 RepID=UPI001AE9E324|nr:metal-dependent transcriptional regulator [Methanobacterium aggregans]MBP2046677.1 DtxR family Mn-dependent transcriptional regulator [Methanobacterium aggregans]